jgi:DUF4097 and DUF4098 domain-containing protein YvlB
MRKPTLLLTLAATPLLFGLEPEKSRVQAEYHQSYPMQPGSRITVDNQNGSIEITGWDQNTLDISATRYAETQQALDQLKIDVATSADGIHIRTLAPQDLGNVGVKYTIKVPRRAELAEIRSTNGAIRVNDVEGSASLHTSNGSVHASKARGKLQIGTSNGAVEVRDIEGDTDVHTSNGSVRASGIRGPLAAVTSNGAMRVDLEESRGGAITLTTTNGAVDLKLGTVTQGEVKAATSNGSITVRIPAVAGAHVKAETSGHSRVSTDFDVRKEGENSPSRLEGIVGAGGPQLNLTTTQGSIRILKI